MPLVGPIMLEGLTVEEANQRVRSAYVEKGILQPGREAVLVTLMQPRDAQIYRETLESTVRETDDILSVFHSLLTIATVESGAPRDRFEPVDPAKLVQAAVEIYEPAAEDVGLADSRALQVAVAAFQARSADRSAAARSLRLRCFSCSSTSGAFTSSRPGIPRAAACSMAACQNRA